MSCVGDAVFENKMFSYLLLLVFFFLSKLSLLQIRPAWLVRLVAVGHRRSWRLLINRYACLRLPSSVCSAKPVLQFSGVSAMDRTTASATEQIGKDGKDGAVGNGGERARPQFQGAGKKGRKGGPKVRRPRVELPDVADTEHVVVPGFHLLPNQLDGALTKSLGEFVSSHPNRGKKGFAIPIDSPSPDEESTPLQQAAAIAATIFALSGERIAQLAKEAAAIENAPSKLIMERNSSAIPEGSWPNFLVVESM